MKPGENNSIFSRQLRSRIQETKESSTNGGILNKVGAGESARRNGYVDEKAF